MTLIRQAGQQDIGALYGLIDALGFHKEQGYFERCLAEQDEGRRQVFIVQDEQKQDAGYGMLNWKPQYALYKKLEIPEIQDLNVIPAARRQGLASAVIGHCETIARARGCDHIGISVGLYPGYGPAQRLYVKLGYVPDGNGVTYDREPVSYGELRPVDDELCLMMVKDISPLSL
ncbi:MAG: GNAT family N-acetyltransferase [Rhodospirillales bacterium]|nr:GNAT family N-acetyltransferase [Rhodospirillales bacterium]MCB9995214.1 GNAT family N-acetyltransferase [Rhodospirillales bacterium]